MLIKNYKTILYILIICIICSCSISINRTENSNDIYQIFRAMESVSYYSIPPRLASIFIDGRDSAGKEFQSLLNDVNRFTLLVIPNGLHSDKNEHFEEINSRLNAINFRDLAMSSNGQEVVHVKINQNVDVIDEVVVLVSNSDAVICLSFMGSINPCKVTRIAEIDSNGMLLNLNEIVRRL